MDIRSTVMEHLIDLLAWHREKALPFVDSVLTEADCEDILEHVRESSTPIVGVAAVVYRVRLRSAGTDQAAKCRAAAEANEHFQLLPKNMRAHRPEGRGDAVPDAPREYRVAERSRGRRREFDER